MLARVLLLGLLALASFSSQAWATGPASYPPGGSGSGTGDIETVGDCLGPVCFEGTAGSTLTGATGTSLILNTDNNIYLSFDTDNNSTATGVVIGSNASGSSATPYLVVSDAAGKNVTLRNATTLRINDPSDDTNYVEIAAPSGIASNFTATFPAETGTVCTTGSVCSGYQASGSYAPANATYIVQTANGTLTNEQAMGALGTGIVINTTTTGVQSIYAGTSCTNQFPRSLNASGAATCASVAAADMAAASVVGGAAGTISDGTVDANDLGVDSVSASELNATGVEAELEAVMDLQDMQGAVTDAQVPDTITASNYLPLAGGTMSGNIAMNSSVTGSYGSSNSNQTFANTATLSTGSQTIVGDSWTPTLTLSTNGNIVDQQRWTGTVSVSGQSPIVEGLYFGPTVDFSNTTNPISIYRVSAGVCAPTFTASTSSGSGPLYQDCWVDASTVNYSASTDMTDTARNPWAPWSLLSSQIFQTSGTGDLTILRGGSSRFQPVFDATTAGSVLTFTDLVGYDAVTPQCSGDNCGSGSVTTTNYTLAWADFSTARDTAYTIGTAYGLRLTDFDKATTNYSLYSNSGSASIYNGGVMDLGDAVPDTSASATTSIVDISPSVDQTGTAPTLNGVLFAPTSTLTATIPVTAALAYSPTLSYGAIIGQTYGLNMTGTVTATSATSQMTAAILRHAATYTSSTPSAEPIVTGTALTDAAIYSSTATSGTATPTNIITVSHDPRIQQNGTGGTMTLTDMIGMVIQGDIYETAGTLNVTNRVGIRVDEYAVNGTTPQVTNNVGIDISALGASGATTNIGIRNADTTVYTPAGAQSISATSSSLTPSATVLQVTATGAIGTLISNPQISDGVDGQIIHIVYSQAANSFTFADGLGLQLAGTMLMDQGNTLTLMYNSALGDWVEIARALN